MVGRSPQGNLIPAGMSSELPGLLDAWGLEFDNSKVLTDNELALRVMMGQGQRAVPHLGMLGVQEIFLLKVILLLTVWRRLICLLRVL